MKDLPRKILSSLINASNENYELHAYGSSEIAAAQKVYKAVERWVNVVNQVISLDIAGMIKLINVHNLCLYLFISRHLLPSFFFLFQIAETNTKKSPKSN